MIYALSPYQISFLKGLFLEYTEPHRIDVQQIGISEEGILIVSYIQYGVMQRYNIPCEPAPSHSITFKP